MMRFSEELKFSVEDVQAVNLSVQNVHESSVHNAAFWEPIIPQAPIPAEDERATKFKRLNVRQSDLEGLGGLRSL